MNIVPEGFRQLRDLDAVMAAFAPIYLKEQDDEGLTMGFRVGAQHCNPAGHCHGGTWASLADVLMGLNVGLLTGMGGPTVSMSLDFLGAAVAGQWVEGRARLLNQTPKLAFAECLFTVDGTPGLRASAVFRRKSARPHFYATLHKQD